MTVDGTAVNAKGRESLTGLRQEPVSKLWPAVTIQDGDGKVSRQVSKVEAVGLGLSSWKTAFAWQVSVISERVWVER